MNIETIIQHAFPVRHFISKHRGLLQFGLILLALVLLGILWPFLIQVFSWPASRVWLLFAAFLPIIVITIQFDQGFDGDGVLALFKWADKYESLASALEEPDARLIAAESEGNLTVIVRVRAKNSVVARYGVPVEVSTAGSEWVLRGRDARAFLEVLQKEAPERLKQLTQGAELQNENQPD